MVFVLDDIKKIEVDRKLQGQEDQFIHVVTESHFFNNVLVSDYTSNVLTRIYNKSNSHVWREGAGLKDVYDTFVQAFYNALWWGNKQKLGSKIDVICKYSELGLVVYVEDQGKGFNFRKQINKIQKGKRHKFNNNGTGMPHFHNTPLHIAYHGKGNLISIATEPLTNESYEKLRREL